MKRNYLWKVINENIISFKVWFTCWIVGAIIGLLILLFLR